ncbi:MAG: purine-nucleoside phosphorylase [Coprobacillus sp.]|nr:purine-nucleoside phosphorylase [Coprobacillus sp.]
MSTPHINAKDGDFAKVVLMPGDPLRAKWIAETYLKEAKLVSDVRGIYAYTGLTKNGKRISVMASGMGQPSIGIYCHELFCEYGVETIIRIGTCGTYQEDIHLFDIILATSASTDSNWIYQYDVPQYSAGSDFELTKVASEVITGRGETLHAGNVLSADVFYDPDTEYWKKWKRLGVLAVEMESYALYVEAAVQHKRALTMLTVTDNFNDRSKKATSEERQTGLSKMVEAAIETAENFA